MFGIFDTDDCEQFEGKKTKRKKNMKNGKKINVLNNGDKYNNNSF